MKDAEIWLFVAVLVFGMGVVVGWHFGSAHVQAALTAQTVSTTTCLDASAAQTQVINTLKDRINSERAERERQQQAALAVLAERDSDIRVLRSVAATKSNTIVETAHAIDDCKPLVSTPVCSAIADSLWPPVAAPDSGQPPRTH